MQEINWKFYKYIGVKQHTTEQLLVQRSLREIKKYLEIYENGKKLWDASKAVPEGNFIVINAYSKNIGTSQINNLTLHIKELLRQEQTLPKPNRKTELNIRLEISEIENRKNQQN